MVVGCDVDASTASASSMRDNAMIPYHQIAAGVKPYFKGSLTKWLSANYEASYGFSKLKIDGEANDYHTFRQNIFTTIIPNDIVQFTVGAEHFLTLFPERNTAGLVLLDASAVWRLSNKVRLSLTGNNLLDRRNYRYVNYGSTLMFRVSLPDTSAQCSRVCPVPVLNPKRRVECYLCRKYCEDDGY